MHNQVRSKRLRVRMVKIEENVVDRGTKALSKSIIAKYNITLGYFNNAEENVEDVQKDVFGLRFQDRTGRKSPSSAGSKDKGRCSTGRRLEQCAGCTVDLVPARDWCTMQYRRVL